MLAVVQRWHKRRSLAEAGLNREALRRQPWVVPSCKREDSKSTAKHHLRMRLVCESDARSEFPGHIPKPGWHSSHAGEQKSALRTKLADRQRRVWICGVGRLRRGGDRQRGSRIEASDGTVVTFRIRLL